MVRHPRNWFCPALSVTKKQASNSSMDHGGGEAGELTVSDAVAVRVL